MSRPGRRVFVTGGSRGIGRAIALRLARDGASRVAIGYFRSDTAAEETADELRALGAEPVLVRGNVTSARVEEQVAALGPRDVEGDAALVRVEEEEEPAPLGMRPVSRKRSPAARGVTAVGRLHLDDVGAVVREELPAVGGRDGVAELEGRDAVQGAVGHDGGGRRRE